MLGHSIHGDTILGALITFIRHGALTVSTLLGASIIFILRGVSITSTILLISTVMDLTITDLIMVTNL